MTSVTATDSVTPLPTAFTVTGYDPATAFDVADSVSTVDPAPAIEAGLKLALTPTGRLLADSVIGAPSAPMTVVERVTLPVEPCTVATVGDALVRV